MLRKWFCALTLLVMLGFVSTPQAEAGKYGSGRSSSGFSSRSSSFGSRSSSFGGSRVSQSSTPKYSSGTKQSSSPPKYSSGSKPSPPPKYSSGSKTDPKPSGSKYGSGSPDTGSSKYGSKGKGFATGGNPSGSSSSTGPPKSGNKLDPGGQLAQQKFDSKNSYKPQAPKTEWKDPKTGQTRSFTQAEKGQVDTVRKTVTHERYITYETRYHDFYGPYGYAGRPMVYYSDPFGPFFYLWLFDRCTADERARWAYNHRSEMDDARWRDMVRRDADLEARVRALEAEKKARDPNYVPPAMKDNPDLMYNPDFVNAAYNPTGASYERPPEVSPEKWRSMSEQEQHQYWVNKHHSGPSAGTVLFWLLMVVLVGAVVVFVIWFIFVRETP